MEHTVQRLVRMTLKICVGTDSKKNMNNTRGSVFVNMTDQEKAYHKRKGTTASGMGGSGGTSDECGGRRVLANQCHVHVNDYHHHVITKLRRNTYILLILCNAASLEPSRRLFTRQSSYVQGYCFRRHHRYSNAALAAFLRSMTFCYENNSLPDTMATYGGVVSCFRELSSL